jgi:hypothetical protein
MNIEVKDGNNKLVEKICKEMKMNPSQLMEYLLSIIQHLYSDYERQKNAGVEKRTFREILTNLFFHSFKSKLRTLDIAENLIESTNELLGINEYIDAGIYNIDLDFYSKSFFYTIGYEFVDAANMNAFKGLLIDVEINQDYIEVSHRGFPHIHESIDITDKKTEQTINHIQEFIRDAHRAEFSPFVNLDVEMFPVVNSIFQTIGIKLIVKSDRATHMPSIETISHLIREVHGIVIKKLVAKQTKLGNEGCQDKR